METLLGSLRYSADAPETRKRQFQEALDALDDEGFFEEMETDTAEDLEEQ